ncbi:hypothetical protein MHYP_G00170220 [Metynnis hypsauchen]
MMEHIWCLCLLLFGSVHMISSETLHVSQKEGNIAVLHCGRLTNGKVTWSRDTNRQRVDILTTHNGETTKHIADPDRRYNSQADLALIILRVSQSDAGRYYCSGATVELSVTSGTILQTCLIIIAVSCVMSVVLVLFSWRCFCKRKENAVTQNQEVIYQSIDDCMPTKQPDNEQFLYENLGPLEIHPSPEDNQQFVYENLGPLKIHPSPEDNQQFVHENAGPLEIHASPEERVPQLYTDIKKCTKQTLDFHFVTALY